jgi:hypothetical protein
VRGVLGYHQTSPVASACTPINERFSDQLSKGKTFLEAWKHAHSTGDLNDRWTAMVTEESKKDTLDSLLALRNGTKKAASAPPALLFFASDKSGEAVDVAAPAALLEMHSWDGTTWTKFLVTNLDFNKKKCDDFAATSAGKALGFVNNNSWDKIQGVSRMVDMSESLWNFYPYFPKAIYNISLFPPFAQPFAKGFEKDDEVGFTLVHVRRDYSKPVKVTDMFDVLLVNGGAPKDQFTVAKSQKASPTNDTIRFKVPGAGFGAAQLTVRFKATGGNGSYLWFWFAVSVFRGGKEILTREFNDYTVSYQADSHYSSVAPTNTLPSTAP